MFFAGSARVALMQQCNTSNLEKMYCRKNLDEMGGEIGLQKRTCWNFYWVESLWALFASRSAPKLWKHVNGMMDADSEIGPIILLDPMHFWPWYVSPDNKINPSYLKNKTYPPLMVSSFSSSFGLQVIVTMNEAGVFDTQGAVIYHLMWFRQGRFWQLPTRDG